MIITECCVFKITTRVLVNFAFAQKSSNQSHGLSVRGKHQNLNLKKNIAKGTTDPRVEFISQDHSSQFTVHKLHILQFQNLD